jgi:hypothetical protein
MYTKNQRDQLDRTRVIEQWFHDTRNTDLLASFHRRLDTLSKEIFFHNTSELQILGSAAAERDALRAERDALLVERDALLVERDAAVAERDALLTERDAVAAELNAVVNSNSWRSTKLLRDLRRFFGEG